MAEPTGIFIDVEIDEIDLKRLLNQKFKKAKFGKKIGYYFSELLYRSYVNEADSVFIFNYDKKSKHCFIGFLVNRFSHTDISPFPKVLEIISSFKKSNSSNYAIVASTFPDLFNAYLLKQNQVIEQSLDDFSNDVVHQMINKFYSFSQGQHFLRPQKALNKRNFFYKNFKKYLAFMEVAEKQKKIANATRKNPLLLFENLYTFENRVFFKSRDKSFVEIPKADPLTLSQTGLSILTDKNHIFIKKMESPLTEINISSFQEINWKYEIIEGIDGKSFEPYKYKYETTYWRDKLSVYYIKEFGDADIIKVVQANQESFEELNFGFGKDKNHIFYRDKIIPINTIHFNLNKNGFIYDEKNIFHYQNQIPLDAKTFKILEYESEQNPFMGTFILEDRSGKYKYNRDWKGETMKLITKYKKTSH
jgi:hypothetical protein